MALFDDNDRKVRLTVALPPEQISEMKAVAFDSDGNPVPLARVVRAAIDFGLRDIRRHRSAGNRRRAAQAL